MTPFASGGDALKAERFVEIKNYELKMKNCWVG
jgi:hypothetical protein